MLAVAAGLGTASVAGCLGDDDDGSDDDTSEESIPARGDLPAEIEALDEAVRSAMEDASIPGGVLGVAHEGSVVCERGYGYADTDESTETDPDARFRIASVSKSLTSAAVHELAAQGRLALEDPVLEYLDVQDPAPAMDAMTVEHCLEHTAGFPAAGTGEDPAFDPLAVADALSLEDPPDPATLTRYALERTLETEPGETEAYSNVGYVVLGEVVAAASGQDYQEYLETTVLPDPDGVDLGQTDPAERPAGEVDYHGEGPAPTALDLESDEEVPDVDGGFLVELLGGAGGHVATTAGLLAFMEDYWVYTGEPRGGESYRLAAEGSMPGTYAFTLQHEDCVSVAALFNRRDADLATLPDALLDAIASIEDWPTG